jgi:hypothetical protein
VPRERKQTISQYTFFLHYFVLSFTSFLSSWLLYLPFVALKRKASVLTL